MKYAFSHEKSSTFARHNGIFIFLQFGFKLKVERNRWGYIAILKQSDFLCKCYERRVFILKKNLNL